MHHAVFVHADHDRRDLEQRIAVGIEAAAFDVDDNRQEAAEALGVFVRGSHARSIRGGQDDLNSEGIHTRSGAGEPSEQEQRECADQ